ncbi:MAG: glycosyltransferase family 4 protein [Magnetococcales bacterium]|nr:glycosyltransferase family 4 protein [Magnetococcales bacterium]
MAVLSQLGLTLFFTSGLALTDWRAAGILERETALYRALLPHLDRVTFITYGDGADRELVPELGGIRVVCNHRRLPAHWYRRLLRFVPGQWRRRPVIYKSNQVQGAETALRLARRAGLPCGVRCGYLASEFAARHHGPDSPRARQARAVEREVFREADRVIVTTPAMARTVQDEYGLDPGRLRVVPNYVDTERFRPAAGLPETRPARILFVGRLEPQKNPLALVAAVAGRPVELVIVGEGSLRGELERAAGPNVRFLGRRPQEELPGLLAGASAFVLPSLYEGHPKALLEAMAAGVPAIGADRPGLREVIRHEQSGLLCEPTAQGIGAALDRLLADAPAARRLGLAARQQMERDVALPRVVAQELAWLEELAATL